jgi:1-acyl-sn-glycerol-3-phosphate acyltransferase
MAVLRMHAGILNAGLSGFASRMKSAITPRTRYSLRQRVRIGFRVTLLFMHVGAGIIGTALLPALRRAGIPENRVAGLWFRLLLVYAGVRVRVHGRPAAGTMLVVSNHVSWVDIPALSAYAGTLFVSKSEVRDWPLIGWFASEIGTVFLPRGGHQTRTAISRIMDKLRDGQPVAIFPEGTTTGQRIPKPFHARLFAAAIENGSTVQTVALHYPPPPGIDTDQHPAAPYIDNIAFGEHFFRLLAAPDVTLDIRFCEVLHSHGRDRRALAHAARASICAALGEDGTTGNGPLVEPALALRSTHSTFT